MTTVLEQCSALVGLQKTEEALTLLMQHSGDAVILKARYNNAVNQRRTGMIDLGEFARIEGQVNYALLELAATTPTPQPAESDAPTFQVL